MKCITVILMALMALNAHARKCAAKSGATFNVEQSGRQIEVTNETTGEFQVDQLLFELPTHTGGYFWGSKFLISWDLDNRGNYLSEIIKASEFAFPKHKILCGFDSDVSSSADSIRPGNQLAGGACCSWGAIPDCWEGC